MNDKKIEFDINEPTNKFYLSDSDSVYVRNRDGEFQISLDGKYLYPAEIDIMWGSLSKDHVDEMIKNKQELVKELQRQ